MKLFILGYMGSGKSTIGLLLAQKMQYNFIDLDVYIENKTKKTITEIFNIEGETKFRELEKQYLSEVINEENTVVALGGGTTCFNNNMDIINQSGTSIYLEMDAETLMERLSTAKNNRPLIQNLNKAELKKFIKATLEKRTPIYNQANIIIKANKINKEGLVKMIIKKITA